VEGVLRFRVHLSVDGDMLRFRISNEFGQAPLVIGGLTVAEATGQGVDEDPSTIATASFERRESVVIPAGAPMLTDAIKFKVRANSDLVVSLRLPQAERLGLGPVRMFRSNKPDALNDAKFPDSIPIRGRPPVTAVEVRVSQPTRVIVALGDSITDSISPDVPAWPEWLARRLEQIGGTQAAVLNAGIGGNRVRISAPGAPWGESALARFDRDVLAVPGLTHVVILEGINDLGLSDGGQGNIFETEARKIPTAEELIGALRQLAARAHAHGVKVVGGTITPFAGAGSDRAPYFSPAKDQVRLAVNEWIRTTHDLDGFIDFDAAVKAPGESPERLRDGFGEPDHLHPSYAGQRAMGDAIDLELFEPTQRRGREP
jgi:lysophospholipase L1-like esterase